MGRDSLLSLLVRCFSDLVEFTHTRVIQGRRQPARRLREGEWHSPLEQFHGFSRAIG